MNGEDKILPAHRSRRAVIYVRQSSAGQVRHNRESQALQYALADHASALGFRQVDVLDVDLGASAAMAAKRRAGFEQLLGAVALGEVGLILSRELSRLLRTDKDFCQLVELCQLFETLIGDEETIYDVTRMDDQLVLGIKATMSVVELHVLRMRLAQGKENKAKRGALYPRLPPGYVWQGEDVVQDPNLRVQEAIQLLFAKFRETWSIRQTFKWFRDNNVSLPVTKAQHGTLRVVFQLPRLSFVTGVLHNPFYAGAYAWGRRPMQVVWREGVLRKRPGRAVPPEEARVFIRDHHTGYIDWTTFEEHQRMISRNTWRGESDETAGAGAEWHRPARRLLRCRRCGRKLHVRYWGKRGRVRGISVRATSSPAGDATVSGSAVRRWIAASAPRSCVCCRPWGSRRAWRRSTGWARRSTTAGRRCSASSSSANTRPRERVTNTTRRTHGIAWWPRSWSGAGT